MPIQKRGAKESTRSPPQTLLPARRGLLSAAGVGARHMEMGRGLPWSPLLAEHPAQGQHTCQGHREQRCFILQGPRHQWAPGSCQH